MLNGNIIPARNLQKYYKSIIESVKASNQVVILTTNEIPQAAIISLEDLEKLRSVKASQNILDILLLAEASREELKSLPSNLREQADEILYGNKK